MDTRVLEQRFAKVGIEKRDNKPAKIVGYASVFYDGTPETEYELWQGAVERIMPMAFSRAIADKDDARGLFNHDPDNVLGRIGSGTLELSVDSRGLKYDIDPPNTQTARDVAELIARGDVTGSSFSFAVTDEEWRRENSVDIREIRGVKLYDVGPVTFPAYDGTTCDMRSEDARKSLEKVNQARVLIDARNAKARAQEVSALV